MDGKGSRSLPPGGGRGPGIPGQRWGWREGTCYQGCRRDFQFCRMGVCGWRKGVWQADTGGVFMGAGRAEGGEAPSLRTSLEQALEVFCRIAADRLYLWQDLPVFGVCGGGVYGTHEGRSRVKQRRKIKHKHLVYKHLTIKFILIALPQSYDQSGKPAMSIQPALYLGERLEETSGWISDRRCIRDLPGHKRMTTTEIHTTIARSKKPRSPLDSLRFSFGYNLYEWYDRSFLFRCNGYIRSMSIGYTLLPATLKDDTTYKIMNRIMKEKMPTLQQKQKSCNPAHEPTQLQHICFCPNA